MFIGRPSHKRRLVDLAVQAGLLQVRVSSTSAFPNIGVDSNQSSQTAGTELVTAASAVSSQRLSASSHNNTSSSESKSKSATASSSSSQSPNAFWKSRVSSNLQYKGGGSWSSPHDNVSRNAFTKDHAHLWTLLEACLDSKSMARAESVLIGLSGLANGPDITLAVNTYLLKLCEINAQSPTVGRVWINQIKNRLPLFKQNSVTDAILLKNMYTAGDMVGIKVFIKTYESNNLSMSELLGHIEVLGLKALSDIVRICHIPLNYVHESYRDIIADSIAYERRLEANDASGTSTTTATTNTAASDNSSDNSVNDNLNAQLSANSTQQQDRGFLKTEHDDSSVISDEVYTVKKGIQDITPTGTVGLKVIRHSLSGLVQKDQEDRFLKQLNELIFDKDLTKGNFIDFLEISNKLVDDPQKLEQFEHLMDELNEARQRALEIKGIEGAREKWKADFEKRKEIVLHKDKQNKAGKDSLMGIRGLNTLLWEWNEAMLPIIKEEFERVEAILKYEDIQNVPAEYKRKMKELGLSCQDRLEYGPYLLLVKPEALAPITMMEILQLHSTGGVSEGMRTARAVLAVGRTVEREYRARLLQEREKATLKGIRDLSRASSCREGGSSTTDGDDTELSSEAKAAAGAVREAVKASDLNTKQSSWPTSIKAKIGSLLISILIQVAKVKVKGTDPVSLDEVTGEAPAIYHSYQYKNGAKVGVLKLHRNLTKHLSGDVMSSAIFPQQLPMLAKPRPWVAYNKGGYLYTSSRIMRSRDAPEQVAYLKAASEQGTMNGVYEGLNVLGSTPWTINRRIFDILAKVWNSGEAFLDIPPNVAPQPELPPAPPRDCDPSERRDWMRQCRKISNENSAFFSQRCDGNYKLEIARAFIGERFYFPHNVDFRGRAYPISPHLNHLGNDMSRGLLMFWEAKPLGEHGLDWLKIHCANLYGYNKHSFADRIKFADDHMEEIIDSAKDPLNGKYKWWQTSEEPWQTLAVCMEIRDALASGDPKSYKCRLPVHQDGSCNGLQHYAALGGDVEGAREVNLIPGEKPQDVYTRVLDIVRERVKEDLEQSDSVKVRAIANVVYGRLSRKIIKQTVMTHVYGVTFVGARAQIANRLKETDDITDVEVYQGSTYLARKVLEAVRSLFEGAHLIQDWLGDNAVRISKSVRLDLVNAASGGKAGKGKSKNGRLDCMSSVIWTTPLGLPIVQPYRQENKKQIQTALQTVYINDPYALRGVNTRKQRTAFPPNFIHSLDATHMLMSAIECGKAGISFAAVHDSYWTHAGDVDTMNKVLRDCFINLYDMNLVEELRQEFIHRYTGLLQFCAIPEDCELAQKIREVQKKHALRIYGVEKKLTMADQLAIEQERLKRLEEGETDEEFETPLSIIEQVPDEVLESLLIHTTEQLKARGLAGKSSKGNFKSTEHKGSGSDMFEVYEGAFDSADATSNTNESVSESSSSSIDDLEKKSSKVMGIFVPLRISPVPPRGDLDVTRLRDSKYFFS